MDRRVVIKNLFLTAGGLMVVGSFSCGREKVFAYKHFNLTEKEQNLLAEVSETIIPATDTPGARELQLHLFTLKMIDDCYDPDSQRKFIDGLKQVNDFSEQKGERAFVSMNQEERIKIVEDISAGKEASDNLEYFLTETKKLTVRGYLNSKYVMTGLLPYVQIPGHFTGCVNIKK